MLILQNIEKNNDIISAEYNPEESGQLGSISINAEGNLVKSQLSDYDNEDFPIYFSHAIDALKDMAKAKELPKEKVIMWY